MNSSANRQIVLDTETTGLSAEHGDRIVELGCVELVGRRLTGNDLHLYFNPERPCDEGAFKVHGLTDAFLGEQAKFSVCARQIINYLEGAEIIIHNAAFDMGFLEMEFARLKLTPLASKVVGVLDTLTLARDLYPGKRNSLDALCDRLEVDRSNRNLHGALLDAQLLARVYLQMTRGQDSLLMAESTQSAVRMTADHAENLSVFELPILRASESELQAHAALLAELDKASAGHAIWRLPLEGEKPVS